MIPIRRIYCLSQKSVGIAEIIFKAARPTEENDLNGKQKKGILPDGYQHLQEHGEIC